MPASTNKELSCTIQMYNNSRNITVDKVNITSCQIYDTYEQQTIGANSTQGN